jgi:hypothetical protein
MYKTMTSSPSPPTEQPVSELQFVSASESDSSELELRVDFGLFAGRDATPAEIEHLGRQLLTRLDQVTIVSEQRYEMGARTEGIVHQVRIVVDPELLPRGDDELAELRGRLLELAERWTRECFVDRHDPISNDLDALARPA